MEGIVVINERINGKAGGVLDRIFPADTGGKLLVCPHPISNYFYLFDKAGPEFAEIISASGIPSIQQVAVGKDNPSRINGLIGIFMGAAVHARSIINDDAAHHSRVDGGRVRSELASVRGENAVDLCADNSLVAGEFCLPHPEPHSLPSLHWP